MTGVQCFSSHFTLILFSLSSETIQGVHFETSDFIGEKTNALRSIERVRSERLSSEKNYKNKSTYCAHVGCGVVTKTDSAINAEIN